MYVQGFIVPVPADKQDEYREVAEKFWPIAHDYGATEHVEWFTAAADQPALLMVLDQRMGSPKPA